MNKKNIISLAVLGGLVIALLAVMIFLSNSVLKEAEAAKEVQSEDPNFVLDGTPIYKKDITRADVARIQINNRDGSYAFVRDNTGEFVIEGMEEIGYNETLFAALFTVTCNL